LIAQTFSHDSFLKASLGKPSAHEKNVKAPPIENKEQRAKKATSKSCPASPSGVANARCQQLKVILTLKKRLTRNSVLVTKEPSLSFNFIVNDLLALTST
jgi:hypothetical protein